MKFVLSILTIFLFSCSGGNSKSNSSTSSAVINAGQNLFTSNCAACHKCDMDFTGPMLKGAFSRWNSRYLLYEYVRNPASVISKNKYAQDLQIKFKGVLMPPFPQLRDTDIDAILNYCGN